MRLSSGLSLVVAVAFGGLAVLLARGLVQGAGSSPSTRTVVVAAEPIAFGAPLGSDNLRQIAWPAGEVPDGAFATIADVTRDGRRLALTRMARNEPLLGARVTPPNGRATLSTQIDEGMRAVTIRVDEVRGVAGFVLPGDRVDVILTRGEGSGGDAGAFADMLLQNAKVLAVDQLANDRQDRPAVARAVTLELSVTEAQKVVLAQGIGRLSLVLRQAGRDEPVAPVRVTVGDLGMAADAVPADRLGDIEKKLDDLSRAADAARAAGNGDAALNRRLLELETRLGQGAIATPPPGFAVPARPAGAVVTVTRNGSKSEQYTVTPER